MDGEKVKNGTMEDKIFEKDMCRYQRGEIGAKNPSAGSKEDWQAVVEVLDGFDANNERRESEHRADADVTITDRDPNEGECHRMADLLRLSRWKDWDDIIFSRHPEDLYQLVETPLVRH